MIFYSLGVLFLFRFYILIYLGQFYSYYYLKLLEVSKVTMEGYRAKLMGEISTILLATDGTEFSEGAVQEALFFANACGAKLNVLHIVKVDLEQEFSTHAQQSVGAIKIAPHLDKIKEMAASLEVDCNIQVKESSNPAKAIVDESKTLSSDVIIMGRHGKTGMAKFFVGSVTAEVIGYTPPKVLVVPKDFILSGNSLLVALDGSPHSNAAADEAISMCSQCPAIKKVVALSVAENDSHVDYAKELIGSFLKKLQSKKDSVQVEALAEVGNPNTIITNKAKEHNVDLVVVGGYGKSGVKKLLMGSVAEKVIALSHCGTLVVNCQQD